MQTELSAEQIVEDAAVAVPALTAGQTLQRERQRQGLSEKEVADRLHITMHYVKALEADNYEKLPGAVFARGYIKSYAVLMGLDADELQALYEAFMNQQEEDAAEAERQQNRGRRDRNRPWVILSIIGFIGGFGGLWAYNNFVGNDESNSPILTPTVTTPNAGNDTQASSPSPPPAAETASVVRSPGSAVDSIESNPDPAPAPVPDSRSVESADFVTTLASLAQDGAVASPPGAEAESEAPAIIEESTVGKVISISTSGEDILRISFSGESWIEVNDGDANQIYRDIREAGDILEITGHAPFNILLGDAPFTSMTFNGTEIDVSDNIRIDNSARLTVGL